MQELTLEQILDVEHAWPVYIIILFMLVCLLIVLAWFLYNRYQEGKDDTKKVWRALVGALPRLPGHNLIRIKPVGEPEIEIKGPDVYILRTDLVQIPIEPEIIKLEEITEVTEEEAKTISQKPIKQKSSALNRDWVKPKEIQTLVPQQQYVEQKIETYLYMDRKQKELVAFQIAGLYPNQSILSKMSEILVAKFRTGTPKIMFLLLAVSLLWNLLINISLLLEQPVDFVLQPYMFGWYTCLGLTIGFQIYLWRSQLGRWAIFWAPHRFDIEIEFAYRDASFKKMVPVYCVEPHYHPQIDIASVYRTDINEITENINQNLVRQIAKVISDNISIRNEKERLAILIEELRGDLDDARLGLRQQKILAYYEYMADAQVSPEYYIPSQSRDYLEKLKWPAAVAVVAVICYLGLSALIDFLEGLTFSTLDKLIMALFGALAVGALIFVFWERHIRKTPFGG